MAGERAMKADGVIDLPARSLDIELAIGALFRMCNALLGARWRPQIVSFTHKAPDDLSIHRRLFGHNVQFEGEFNGVVCSGADMDRANPSADPKMASYARRFITAGRSWLSQLFQFLLAEHFQQGQQVFGAAITLCPSTYLKQR